METGRQNQYSHTLCWECSKATGGCNWSDELKPVKGWKITPTKRTIQSGRVIYSCIVHECPEFDRDAYKNGLKRYKKDQKDELLEYLKK